MSLSIQNISKSFGANALFSDFSLELGSGVRLCVCGPNGCGKTTLLKILAGSDKPDSGKIVAIRTARIGYVKQELGEEELDVNLLDWILEVLPDWNDFWHEWEQALAAKDEAAIERLAHRQADLEHLYGYNPEHRARAVLSGLGFSERKLGRTLRQLSGGWRERAKLAKVLTAGADVLLLDEPTNHLDLEAVEWLEKFILDYEGVLVFVAHDRVFMDNVGTHVLYLGASKPVYRKGNFSQFISMQEEFEEQREREAKRLAEEIDRKMDFVRRFRAKPNKARQAASRQKMAKKLEKELENYRPEAKRKELEFKWPQPERCENVVLSGAGLGFTFSDGKTQFSNLDFNLYRGQKVAMVGPNGCGKTTLLRVLTGRLERTTGTFALGSGVKLGYFSQHQMETLNPQNTVLAEIRRLADPRTTEEELMSVLGLFLLGQNYFDRQVAGLSGGEKSRLILASLFLARCNFLILDEPTNHLDLESRETLIEALENFEGTVLMVAHDRNLLARVAEQIWEFNPTGLKIYLGGYAEYNQARKEEQRLLENDNAKPGGVKQSASEKVPSRKSTDGLDKEQIKALRRERAEQRNALSRKFKPQQDAYNAKEKELEEALHRQSSVEAELALPEVYADSARTSELLTEFTQLGQKVDVLLADLEKLEAGLAEFEALKTELDGE